MYHLIRPLLFKMDAEDAHEFIKKSIASLPSTYRFFCRENYSKAQKDLRFTQKIGDLVCPYPVGIAAGLDKNAEMMDFWRHFPLGQIEVGTVTVRPQEGNPRPRLFRLKEEQSLLNRMGFNNDGSDIVLERLERYRHRYGWKSGGPLIGVNIGKNKETSLEAAHREYALLAQKFKGVADYIAINISSPNTSDLRNLQSADYLENLLEKVKEKAEGKTLLLKISPDLTLQEVDEIFSLCQRMKVSGIIVTNTTIIKEVGVGGVSGKMLFERAKIIRQHLLELNKGNEQFSIIGSGGFSKVEEMKDFWEKGGSLIQLYSALIYEGPGIFEKIRSCMLS